MSNSSVTEGAWLIPGWIRSFVVLALFGAVASFATLQVQFAFLKGQLEERAVWANTVLQDINTRDVILEQKIERVKDLVLQIMITGLHDPSGIDD